MFTKFRFLSFKCLLPYVAVMIPTMGQSQSWRSTLYPENWTPPGESVSFASDKLIQDFSYAGYKRGEEPIPNIVGPIFDVTAYGADPSGASDSTVAIQNTINAAATAGGGVVFLPAGEFRVSPQGTNTSCLRISSSNIVLRGAGTAATFLLNTSYTMNGKTIIQVSPPSLPLGTSRNITADLPGPTRRIPVENASSFAPGNIVRIEWEFTDAWIIENNQQTWWNATKGRPSNARYLREVTATNAAEGWIEVDVPTRYAMKTRDSAKVQPLSGFLTNVGIESLAIGNLQHPGSGWGEEDYTDSTKAAYDAHNSWLIRFSNVRDSWASSVHSRQATANTRTCHMLSNGISLVGCSRITVQSCQMRRPQYGGGGGNGYMYRVQSSNECLIRNSLADFSRHGFVVSHAGTSGNVFLQCEDKETQRAIGSSSTGYTTGGSGSDNHMHFSHSNLWDQCHAHNSFYTAHHRLFNGTTPHGVTSAHGVYWNTSGSGTRYTDIVRSEQLHYGYVIGTSGTRFGATNPTGGNTAPADHLEGIELGTTMEVPSLYTDQLAKRMQGILVDAGSEGFTGVTSAYPLSGSVYTYGSAPLTYQWTQLSGPAAAVFANDSSLATTVALPVLGTYVLQLSATDGSHSASAQVVIRVGTTAASTAAHFIRGESQNASTLPPGYFTSGSDISGTQGASGSRDDRNIVIGYTLPTLPPGTTLESAALKFEITQARDSTGAANLPELHAYLLDSENPAGSGTSFFYHGALDPSPSAKRVGITSVPITGTADNNFALGQQVRFFTLSGDALALLKGFYNGPTPIRSMVYLRFNLSVDPALTDLRRYRVNVAAGGSSLYLNSNANPAVDAGPDQTVVINNQALWSPAQTSVTAWYDAADTNTINSSGGAVSSWDDKSGNSNHLSQDDTTRQPSTGNSTLNGLNILDFTDDYIFTTSGLGADIRSVFMVTANNAPITSATPAMILLSTAGGEISTGDGYGSSTGAFTGEVLSVFDEDTTSFLKRQAASSSKLPTITAGAHLYTYALASDWFIGLDGSDDLRDLTSGAARNPMLFANSFCLGAGARKYPGLVEYFYNGSVAEVILLNATVNQAQRQIIEGYLAHKWNLLANLPTNHPYKADAPLVESTATAALAGSASDAENDPLTHTWSVVSGPGPVTFSNPSMLNTNANFSAVGVYTLRLTSSDAYGSGYDEVVITVENAEANDPFANWAADESITFMGDANHDGVADGLAWLLGADGPTENARGLIPLASANNGALETSFSMLKQAKRGDAVLKIQYGTDLEEWTTVTIPEVSGTQNGVQFSIVPIGDVNEVQVTIPAGERLFIRLSGSL